MQKRRILTSVCVIGLLATIIAPAARAQEVPANHASKANVVVVDHDATSKPVES